VIDASNAASPQRVGGYHTNGYAYGVAVSGNYAYVADEDAGLEVIDVSNPANPQRVGGYDTSGTAYGVMPPVQGLDIFSMADPGRRSANGLGIAIRIFLEP